MDSPLNQIIVTIVTALGSAGAWQFYQNRMKVKTLQRKQDKDDKNLYRDDLRERVAILEQRLEQAYQEKEKTSQELAVVMSQMAEYKVRIEFLEKENDRLQSTK